MLISPGMLNLSLLETRSRHFQVPFSTEFNKTQVPTCKIRETMGGGSRSGKPGGLQLGFVHFK